MVGSLLDTVFSDGCWTMRTRNESVSCRWVSRGKRLSTYLRQVCWTHRCFADEATGLEYVWKGFLPAFFRFLDFFQRQGVAFGLQDFRLVEEKG